MEIVSCPDLSVLIFKLIILSVVSTLHVGCIQQPSDQNYICIEGSLFSQTSTEPCNSIPKQNGVGVPENLLLRYCLLICGIGVASVVGVVGEKALRMYRTARRIHRPSVCSTEKERNVKSGCLDA